MFSATFKKKIERLARDVLTDPVKIIQGDIGEATEDVTQIMVFMKSKEQKDIDNEKFAWLAEHLVDFSSRGSVLIFVTKKANCEIVAEKLRQRDHKRKYIEVSSNLKWKKIHHQREQKRETHTLYNHHYYQSNSQKLTYFLGVNN